MKQGYTIKNYGTIDQDTKFITVHNFPEAGEIVLAGWDGLSPNLDHYCTVAIFKIKMK